MIPPTIHWKCQIVLLCQSPEKEKFRENIEWCVTKLIGMQAAADGCGPKDNRNGD